MHEYVSVVCGCKVRVNAHCSTSNFLGEEINESLVLARASKQKWCHLIEKL